MRTLVYITCALLCLSAITVSGSNVDMINYIKSLTSNQAIHEGLANGELTVNSEGQIFSHFGTQRVYIQTMTEAEIDEEWNAFVATHRKPEDPRAYPNEAEKAARKIQFTANARKVTDHNGQTDSPFAFGFNYFSDMNEAEYNQFVQGQMLPTKPGMNTINPNVANKIKKRGLASETKRRGTRTAKDAGTEATIIDPTEGRDDAAKNALRERILQDMQGDFTSHGNTAQAQARAQALQNILKNKLGKKAAKFGKYMFMETDASTDIKTGKSKNWVTDGYVTGIKSQGLVGSCWDFAGVGAVESAWAIKTAAYGSKKLVSLSEEQIIDCCVSGTGCDGDPQGGWYSEVFDFYRGTGSSTGARAICTESSYEYDSYWSFGSGSDRKCQSCTDSRARVSGYGNVKSNDANALVAALDQQPVSVAVDASGVAFQLYAFGTFYPKVWGVSYCKSSPPTHAVIAVGYTDDYYIIKNSWGTSWGWGPSSSVPSGYMKLARSGNACGILSYGEYPIIESKAAVLAAGGCSLTSTVVTNGALAGDCSTGAVIKGKTCTVTCKSGYKASGTAPVCNTPGATLTAQTCVKGFRASDARERLRQAFEALLSE